MKGKAGCLVVLILALIVTYDRWQIMQLQNEVRAISSKLHSSEKSNSTSGDSDLVTTLAKAEKHAKDAKKQLQEKNFGAAQKELDKALNSLRSANDVSRDIIGDAAEALGNARDKAVVVFQKAWKDISEEAKPKQ